MSVEARGLCLTLKRDGVITIGDGVEIEITPQWKRLSFPCQVRLRIRAPKGTNVGRRDRTPDEMVEVEKIQHEIAKEKFSRDIARKHIAKNGG